MNEKDEMQGKANTQRKANTKGRAPMKVTVAMSITDEQLQQIKSAAPDWEYEKRFSRGLHREDLLDSDIVIGTVSTAILHDLPKLKFLQLDFAGSDNYAALPIFHEDNAPILANASGAFGVTISEHMIACILTLIRGLTIYHDNMRENKWSRDHVPELIYGKTCLVLGLGDIGSNFAMRMNALGCKVIAIKRTPLQAPDQCPPYVDAVYTMDQLDQVLPQVDFIGCCLPNSPRTQKVINEHTLSLMKKSAIIVNVGRGKAIDSGALATALKTHRIGGAALDVTDPEPLPSDHALWDCPNCLITPHVSGLSIQPDPEQRILDIICRNLKNFKEGRPIENEVDIETGYRKRK